MRVIIFEDEIPAYKKLEHYIKTFYPNFEIIAWGRSIEEGIEILKAHTDIDLIFSDIELLDGPSFKIFESLTVNTPIVFCTAFDQYLYKAFQSNGIAYVLKPYTEEQFDQAVKKYLQLFEKNEHKGLNNQLIQEFKSLLNGDKQEYKIRFSIKKKNGIKLLKTEDIKFLKANGDFCMAYDIKNQSNVINQSLSSIEVRLDPKQFFRINRSELINVDFIENVESGFKNKLIITIKNSDTKLQTSASKTPDFRTWLDS